ncbi:hypothetical protein PsAD46_03918 [Pseudovibrio sp. Ad46]|uniref:Shedu immune nuclease family protein n=1 Tax=Pseudovibrio sp. Ad46 TaxID=989432 RepID=UPI0007AE8CF8|nr:Shedu immune nuclease family protein [Pseudovibrio sp. Ad46]KZK80870.1 hypothetical protein PsAD46_03918 [Pseudovibrio sp. Ad46]
MEDKAKYFLNRKETKTYISKLFQYDAQSEPLRNVQMVMEGSDIVHLGEIEGAMCLRLTGKVRKTQVTAVVSQDDNEVRRLTFQTFQSRKNGSIQGYDEHSFTFRDDEFYRLLNFLEQIKFTNLTNHAKFQIEDISTQPGPKAIIDSSERAIVEQIREMDPRKRDSVIQGLSGSLTSEEINVLLGRKNGLQEFEKQFAVSDWSEPKWQDFFERNQWVFGYGLDYRVMHPFEREAVVGRAGTDNKNKPIVDFLQTFKDYTVLVEIKRPDTRIFKSAKGGRAGTWEFSSEFTGAVSQILQQKAEWLACAQGGDHWSKDGTRKLEARTRNSKTILVVGSLQEFEEPDNARDTQIKRDTFELFRRDLKNIDILTFDELLERARFITSNT